MVTIWGGYDLGWLRSGLVIVSWEYTIWDGYELTWQRAGMVMVCDEYDMDGLELPGMSTI